MSFVHFDTSSFPIVNVKLRGTLQTADELDELLLKWEALYERRVTFTLVFDTTEIVHVPIMYCMRMAMFIRKIRFRSKDYLIKTVVVMNSTFVLNLLSIILSIQKPICPVVLIDCNQIVDVCETLTDVLQNRERSDVQLILPVEEETGGFGSNLSRYIFGNTNGRVLESVITSNINGGSGGSGGNSAFDI
jgi:hypothetical protein